MLMRSDAIAGCRDELANLRRVRRRLLDQSLLSREIEHQSARPAFASSSRLDVAVIAKRCQLVELKSSALGKIADSRPCDRRPSNCCTPSTPKSIELVDRTQHRQPLPAFSSPPSRSPPSPHRAPCGYSPSPHSCRAECRALPSCPPPSCTSRRRPPASAEPTVSASNCMNWRKRPGPGFSLR